VLKPCALLVSPPWWVASNPPYRLISFWRIGIVSISAVLSDAATGLPRRSFTPLSWPTSSTSNL